MKSAREGLLSILACALVYTVFTLVFADPAAASEVAAHGGHDIGTELPVWTVIPFAGILLSIAL